MNEDNPSPRRTVQKVYRGFQRRGYSFKEHPFIRLGGIYLSDFDFEIGDTIEVTIEPGKISINKMLDSKSESD